MVGILFVGLIAYQSLPVAPLPKVDFPTIQVSAQLPGASAETMASSVAQPLERQFAQIPGVSQTTSSSGLGTTTVVVQFDLDRNIDAAANDIQAAINAASGQLPRDLPAPPTYRKVNPANSPILLLSVTSDALPLTEVDDNADTKLAQQISQISGVGQVTIGGEQKPAIRIQLDPAKLVAKNISLEDVRTQLAITTVNTPKGSIDGEVRSYTIYANDQLTVADAWNDVIIAYRNGAPLRIRDIGQAVAGPEDAKKAAWASGKRGVFLVVFKQPGANVIETVDRIKAQLPRLRTAMPPSIKVEILSDRTQTIRASVEDVAVHLAADHRPGGRRDLHLPAHLLGDRHPERHRAALAARRVRAHVFDELQPRQHLADGADDLGRLRGRRRHRHAGEHRAPRRGRHAAVRGGAEGLGRDRLHDRLDQHLAGGRVHPAAAARRHHRPPVPRVRGHHHHVHRRVGVRRPDADADDGLALPAQRARRRSTAASTTLTERGFDRMLRGYERGLDVVLRHQFATLCVFLATLVAHRSTCSSASPRASSRSRIPASSPAFRRPGRTSPSPR